MLHVRICWYMLAGIETVYVRWSFVDSRPMKKCVDVVLDPFSIVAPLPMNAAGESDTQCSLLAGTAPVSRRRIILLECGIPVCGMAYNKTTCDQDPDRRAKAFGSSHTNEFLTGFIRQSCIGCPPHMYMMPSPMH